MLHPASLDAAGPESDELTQIARLDLDQNVNKFQELVSSLSLIEYLCTLDELSPCIMKKYLGKNNKNYNSFRIKPLKFVFFFFFKIKFLR